MRFLLFLLLFSTNVLSRSPTHSMAMAFTKQFKTQIFSSLITRLANNSAGKWAQSHMFPCTSSIARKVASQSPAQARRSSFDPWRDSVALITPMSSLGDYPDPVLSLTYCQTNRDPLRSYRLYQEVDHFRDRLLTCRNRLHYPRAGSSVKNEIGGKIHLYQNVGQLICCYPFTMLHRMEIHTSELTQ